MLAQLCPPSMTFPIQHALLHPARAPGVDAALDFTKLVGLEFRPIDDTRFPLLRLARATMQAGVRLHVAIHFIELTLSFFQPTRGSL